MQFEILYPVASALEEMRGETTQESIGYNYQQHCQNLAENRADPVETALLPELNQAIIDRWGEKALLRMKKKACAAPH